LLIEACQSTKLVINQHEGKKPTTAAVHPSTRDIKLKQNLSQVQTPNKVMMMTIRGKLHNDEEESRWSPAAQDILHAAFALLSLSIRRP